MINNFIKDIYKKNSELFILIYQFNILPSLYIHTDKLTNIIEYDIYKGLRDSKRAHLIFSKLILKKYNLQDNYIFDFEDEYRRIALLNNDILEKLIYFLGIMLHAPMITKIIEKNRLLKLKKIIGRNAYQFAVKKALFLLKEFPDIRVETDIDNMRLSAIDVGKRCLKTLFVEEPKALMGRFRLKLSEEMDFFVNDPLPLSKDRIWLLVKKVLWQEVGRKWVHLFY